MVSSAILVPLAAWRIRYSKRFVVVLKGIVAVAVCISLLNLAAERSLRYWENARIQKRRSTGVPRVAMLDGTGPGHEEVVLPLLWTMQKLPVQVDLYRNMFRPQTKEALQSWFRGEVHPYDDLWKQDMVDLDIIFLANGDRDVHRMIRQGVMKAYPHLRIVAVVHKADRWDIERTDHFVAEGTAARQIPGPVFETVNALIRQDRWTFVTISPHVKDTLSSLFLAPLHTGHSFGQLVHVFIPVMPVPRAERGDSRHLEPFKAYIVGRIMRSRGYGKILAALVRAKKDRPHWWQARRLADRLTESDTSKAELNSAFVLALLGAPDRKRLRIPPQVQDLVEISKHIVGHNKFYEQLSTGDIVIPALADKEEYTVNKASGAIAAAVMARVPVLVDSNELQAYSYLKPPAYFLREEGEDEIEAIARMRMVSSKQEIASENATSAWKAYEESLYEMNTKAMSEILRLEASPSPRP